jgi:ribose 5-phosphate isomerase A
MTVAERALELIRDGNTVGLGSGRAANAFVEALGKRVQGGLRIRGVPTSQATADLATRFGIPLIALGEDVTIDVTVDGADEVDPQLDLIKGYGGALVREKIVAAASRRLVILVGTEKLVPVLGSRGILPVEVLPFAAGYCHRRLRGMGFRPTLRTQNDQPYITDNGNHILNVGIPTIAKPAELDTQILAIPGVVGDGLFIGMAHVILIQDGERVETRERS